MMLLATIQVQSHNLIFQKGGTENTVYPFRKNGEDVFSLLWNKNEGLTKLFWSVDKRVQEICPALISMSHFSAVLREKGPLLDVSWLNRTCGEVADSLSESPLVESDTEIYDSE